MDVLNTYLQYLTSWNRKKVGSPDVSGKWINDLGSVMELKEDYTGKISGTYRNAAELLKSNEPVETADFVGYTNTHKDKDTGITTTTITFCMPWKTGGSCSAFTGQYFQGENVIKTTWLQHLPMDDIMENWKAARVGENTFKKFTHK